MTALQSSALADPELARRGRRKTTSLAFAASAVVHLVLLGWLAAPVFEVPQIAGGGASFGIGGEAADPSDMADALELDASDMADEMTAEEEAELPAEQDMVEPEMVVPAPVQQVNPAQERAPVQQLRSSPPARPPATRSRPASTPAAQPRAEQARPAPARQQPATNAQSRDGPQADIQSDRTGTGTGPVSGPGDAATTNYAGRVLQQIQRSRRTDMIGAGSVRVSLVIASDGRLTSTAVERSSGSSRFDREALRIVRRAAPFPAPPPGINTHLIIEVEGN